MFKNLIEKYQQELYDLEARADYIHHMKESKIIEDENREIDIELGKILGQMQAYSAVLVDLRGMG